MILFDFFSFLLSWFIAQIVNCQLIVLNLFTQTNKFIISHLRLDKMRSLRLTSSALLFILVCIIDFDHQQWNVSFFSVFFNSFILYDFLVRFPPIRRRSLLCFLIQMLLWTLHWAIYQIKSKATGKCSFSLCYLF